MTFIMAIFGAPDPEREFAMELARECGIGIGEALFDGRVVSPETAYRANGLNIISGALEPGDTVLLFECGGEHLFSSHPGEYVVQILDHHRPGDPGYNLPPKDFFKASALGQFIHALAQHNKLKYNVSWHEPGPDFVHDPYIYGSIWSFAPDVFGEIVWRKHDKCFRYNISKEMVFAAAADHCLAAAYRGECPGVDPDELMEWRVGVRANFQKRDPSEILADVERAREALRTAPRVDLGGEQVADLRGQVVAELPEAAAREGIAFLATPPVRPGERRKVVLQCAGERALKAWPSWAQAQGLVDLYGGDPARGFAGGYCT